MPAPRSGSLRVKEVGSAWVSSQSLLHPPNTHTHRKTLYKRDAQRWKITCLGSNSGSFGGILSLWIYSNFVGLVLLLDLGRPQILTRYSTLDTLTGLSLSLKFNFWRKVPRLLLCLPPKYLPSLWNAAPNKLSARWFQQHNANKQSDRLNIVTDHFPQQKTDTKVFFWSGHLINP